MARVPLGEQLRAHIGEWVAVRGESVIAAAESPAQLVGSLQEENARADYVLRVPERPESDLSDRPI